ncbi:MAG TPA: amidohydrolase [Jatrophihabitantaceae bacterium]|nr:amidohydrolase [Jatrophihabitantaceae bacterium]
MTDSSAVAVLAGLPDVRGWVEDFYRDLHQHPELSHAEQRTGARVAERLRAAGFEVHDGVGGTGVVGVLANGAGRTVLVRADMDALPVREATRLPYASSVEGTDADGVSVPIMHACGHDVHVACLLGAADLLAAARESWRGTVIALFQPAEETADGARGMIDDGLLDLAPAPNVALAQHVLPFPAGEVRTRSGPVLSSADSMRVTVHGRGAHGSMPQAAVDPVLLAASIVVRLQSIVSREVAPDEPAVLTVGSIQAGTKSNVIPDVAQLLLNVRTYSEATRKTVLDAIKRIVTAECDASGSPEPPEFELFEHFPLTDNDAAAARSLSAAFGDYFGDRAGPLDRQSASEDFSDLPRAFGVPYCYWGIGGIDAATYQAAEAAGRVAQDIPVNHSAQFAPVIQPTLDTGIEALVVAALRMLEPQPA